MENYSMGGAAVLSKDNLASTESVIAAAIEAIPYSAIANIIPVTDIKSSSTYWVEPSFSVDGIKLISEVVNLDGEDKPARLSFTVIAAEDLRKTYTPEAFKNLVQSWVLSYKFNRQRNQLIDLLLSPAVNIPSMTTPIDLLMASEDEVSSIKSSIMHAIMSIDRRFKFGLMSYSIVGPFEISWLVLELQSLVPGKIHFMGDERIKDIFVFPTGTKSQSGSGYYGAAFSLFEFKDTLQATYDSTYGEEVFFYYNRSKVALNPIHAKERIVEVIKLS